MIDTHCHLTHPDLAPDLDAVIDRAREAGLAGCVTIGTGVADARQARALAERFPGFVHCAAGVDPFSAHEAGDRFAVELAALRELLADPTFVAVGEVGLDYHYELGSPAAQAARLEPQLELAVALDRPVVLHVREAHDDLAAILARHPRARGVVHSFTGGPAEAARYLELGWHLAFNGIATFASAASVRATAALTPADRLLVETDSPYLAPVPRRGKRCEPAFVVHTLCALAAARGEATEELAALTSANAARLFRLPLLGRRPPAEAAV